MLVLPLRKKSYIILILILILNIITMAKHIITTIKPKDKNFSAADAVHDAHQWIMEDFAPNCCRQPSGSNQWFTKCTCMQFLAEEENTRTSMYLAEYLVRFAGMNRDVKRDLLYEWAK